MISIVWLRSNLRRFILLADELLLTFPLDREITGLYFEWTDVYPLELTYTHVWCAFTNFSYGIRKYYSQCCGTLCVCGGGVKPVYNTGCDESNVLQLHNWGKKTDKIVGKKKEKKNIDFYLSFPILQIGNVIFAAPGY